MKLWDRESKRSIRAGTLRHVVTWRQYRIGAKTELLAGAEFDWDLHAYELQRFFAVRTRAEKFARAVARRNDLPASVSYLETERIERLCGDTGYWVRVGDEPVEFSRD